MPTTKVRPARAQPSAAKKPVTAKARRTNTHSKTTESPGKLIDAKIKELNDWRGELLARLRALMT